MRFALIAPLLALLAACSDDSAACTGACQTTEKTFGLDGRTVHDARTKDFTADGVAYTLVRVEYGDTPECSELDDEDCWYSSYCGWVVDNVDYPMEVYWVTDADALFAPADYGCDPEDDIESCELPGQTLPILEDADFEDWMYDVDPDAEPIAQCFENYW